MPDLATGAMKAPLLPMKQVTIEIPPAPPSSTCFGAPTH